MLTYIFITLGYVSHSGITGSYDTCMFNFKINFQNVSQTDCTILHVYMYVCIYIYWCCLISLTRASISMLNRSGNNILLPLSSLWMKAFGLSSLNIGFSFIRLRKLLFITSLLTVFIGIGFCHMIYLCLLWWDWTFLLYPINMMYYLNWISDIKTTLDGWHKSLLVMLYNLFPF